MAADALVLSIMRVKLCRMRTDVERMMTTVRAHEALVQALRIRIARLQQQKFGPSSERIEREIEQLKLAPEVAASSVGELIPDEEDDVEAVEEPQPEAPPRRRRPKVSATTPRDRVVLGPGEA